MPTVTVFTAERMQAIEDQAIVGGEIVDGNLILHRHNGTTLDAGPVATGGLVLPGTIKVENGELGEGELGGIGPGGKAALRLGTDVIIFRDAVNVVRTDDTVSIADLIKLLKEGSIQLLATDTNGFIELPEQIGLPAANPNKARFFARDNGSGKTQLCVVFGSGAVQVISTEP